MKLGELLKYVPDYQAILLIERGRILVDKERLCYANVEAYKNKTVGTISSGCGWITIFVYER